MISFTYDQVPFYISCSSSYVCCFVLIALYCFQTLRRRALFRYTLPPQVIAKQFDRFAHSCYPKGTFKLKNEILGGLTVLKNWILYMFIRWKSMRWGCILYILGLLVCLFLTLKFRQQVATDMVMVALFLHANLNIVTWLSCGPISHVHHIIVFRVKWLNLGWELSRYEIILLFLNFISCPLFLSGKHKHTRKHWRYF